MKKRVIPTSGGQVRTRFAPSPTGLIQMGNARTALFNYLFTKKQKGTFVLRIEDTDKERSRKEWEQDILENLQWLGLEWDEGPTLENPKSEIRNKFKIQNYIGNYGPYRQSERTDIYKKYLEQLLEQGSAYYCFCTLEELDAQRQHQLSLGETPKYGGRCRSLTKSDQRERLKEGKSAVVRFAVEQKTVTFQDIIRGPVAFDTGLLGDIVIAKGLNSPLYNFSVVVDDFEMRITHVIRGEDHISNTPKQILIQEALEFPMVRYAHVPLLLGEDRTKLSKRHGDTSLTAYREKGYLPEAVVNFLVLLGWNPGNDQEIFSLPQLVKEFSLERIQKGGAVFNVQRLDWLNGVYIRKKSIKEVTKLCLPYLTKEGEERVNIPLLEKIVSLYHERLKRLSEITELTDFFFKKQLEYPKELLLWKDAADEQTKENLKKLETIVSRIGKGEWTKEKIEKAVMPEAEKEKDRGYMLWPLRAALSGKKASAGPFEIMEVLGKEKTLDRIREAMSKLTAGNK